MELEDLKNSWDELGKQAEQQHLTPQTIDQMTQRNYYKKVNGIAYPELTGIFICLAAAVFIGFNINKLDTLILQGAGIAAILLLLTLSAISLVSLRELNISGDLNQPHGETLKLFATRRLRFHRLQKINVVLCYLLLVAIILLLPKMVSGTDISGNTYFWTFSFTIGYLFLLFYSRLVSRFYKNSLSQAEELLRELQPGGN